MAKKDKEPGVLQDELASTLATNLNKKFKESHSKVAYFLDGDSDSPSEVTDWVSTGSTSLDLAVSNRPNGGWPVGRIVELTGLEAAGKSLLAAHALANTQKKNGIGVYIDTESAINSEFLSAIGVDLKKMLYVPLETIEDIFESIESIIETVRKGNKDTVITIVVDSVAGASTKVEMAADFDKDGYNTSKAILLSKAMRKITNLIAKEKILVIFTNQLRSKMNAMAFADPYTTAGGKAIAYHSSVRIRLAPNGQIKGKRNGKEDVLGIKTVAKVIKNRMGPPLRTAKFDIYFDRGIDDETSLLELLKELQIADNTGAWYVLVDPSTGETLDLKFQAKTFKSIVLDNPEIYSKVKQWVYDRYIVKYKDSLDSDIEIIHSDSIIEE
jgi:recombination protein RecA